MKSKAPSALLKSVTNLESRREKAMRRRKKPMMTRIVKVWLIS